MSIEIINKYKYTGEFIYCGRGSPLGNPFPITKTNSRDEVCDRYEVWAREQTESDTPFKKEIIRLINIYESTGELTLGCFCTPKRCHVETVKKLILNNSNLKNETNTLNNFMTNNTAMDTYSSKQWVLIDAASKYGMDKDTYPERLSWGRELLEDIRNGSDCQGWIETAKEPALFCKAIIAIQDILADATTGHVIGLDAAASGPQLLSIMTHCETGMRNTGALNTGSVPDLYTTIYKNMITQSLELSRDQVKKATVPFVYGSDQAPDNVFGSAAPDFVEAYERTVPLAAMVRTILINAWDESAYFYQYYLPDGALVHLECRINDDFKGNTMGNYSYTYRCAVNRPLKSYEKGAKSLVANVTHSCDAFVVREIGARCDYNTKLIKTAITAIESHMESEFKDAEYDAGEHANLELILLEKLWKKFNFLSVTAIELIRNGNLHGLSDEYLLALSEKAHWMLEYNSFRIFTIHDEFKCSPNNIERMRQVYNSIIAELYKSTWLLDTMETLTGNSYSWTEPTKEEIYIELLNSNYAIG